MAWVNVINTDILETIYEFLKFGSVMPSVVVLAITLECCVSQQLDEASLSRTW